MAEPAEQQKHDAAPPVTIKKYANRRLYNTATSSYVTLDHLAQMVKEGVDFVVYDAKTGEDITRSVLTQIIVEEEAKGQNLLPISFLRTLISFYGDQMQWMVPTYLDQAMAAFTKEQDRMRDYFANTFGGMFPFSAALGEMGKQNLAMFEQAMRMFTPPGTAATGKPSPEREMEELKRRMEELQRQTGKSSG
jgi:polyhydroxyalkanoate synthesis repressor PhaR